MAFSNAAEGAPAMYFERSWSTRDGFVMYTRKKRNENEI